VQERLAAAGVEAMSSTPEQLGALITSEVAKWGKVVKASGIRLE